MPVLQFSYKTCWTTERTGCSHHLPEVDLFLSSILIEVQGKYINIPSLFSNMSRFFYNFWLLSLNTRPELMVTSFFNIQFSLFSIH